jgi:hypothetical protein
MSQTARPTRQDRVAVKYLERILEAWAAGELSALETAVLIALVRAPSWSEFMCIYGVLSSACPQGLACEVTPVARAEAG